MFFPLLYWPVTAGPAAALARRAVAKHQRYHEASAARFSSTPATPTPARPACAATTPPAGALRRMLAKLDIPPLEPVPPDHVLTKSFYLLQNFPGR